jgi:purine-binding chemotaxis protein CheW
VGGVSWLSFEVGGRGFALRVAHAREILAGASVTRVPNAPVAFRGVTNVRGAILPVLDAGVRLGLPAASREDAELVVLESAHGDCGLLVDRVSALHAEGERGLLPRPAAGPVSGVRLVLGLLPAPTGAPLVALDVNVLLDLDEIRRCNGPAARLRAGDAATPAGGSAITAPPGEPPASRAEARAHRAAPAPADPLSPPPSRDLTLPGAVATASPELARDAAIGPPEEARRHVQLPARSSSSPAPDRAPSGPAALARRAAPARSARGAPVPLALAVPGPTGRIGTPPPGEIGSEPPPEPRAVAARPGRGAWAIAAAAVALAVALALRAISSGVAPPETLSVPARPPGATLPGAVESATRRAIEPSDAARPAPVATTTPAPEPTPAPTALPAPAPGTAAAPPPPDSGEPRGEGAVVTVRRGDSLWTLARRYRGDPYRWPVLHRANADQVPDPDVISPGQRLRIPPAPVPRR